MKKFLYIFLLIFGFAFSWQNANATHIVGGELNYKFLGNNQYRVTLKLYKDCGISVVPFDNPAGIYVYNANNQVIDTLQLPIIERDTLDANFQDTCLIVPPEICVDFARYEGVFTIPISPSGYTLAYIRCCRNATIVNAQGIDDFGNPINPDLIGATYTVKIPASNITNTNSSPEYKELAPIILCSGQNIRVDQSAIDLDGDQLVYSLCTPNVGGSLQQVFGNPLNEVPPFDLINWIPPYGTDNVIGGEIPLNIDPTTGLLTGSAPNMIGQFVVGVCVQEFRNGVLLSENKRDFQFNIADCAKVYDGDYEIVDEPITDTLQTIINDTLFNYTLLCDVDLSVQFQNLTTGGTEIAWNFGDGSPIDFQTNPLHIFPDTGLYWVTLIAQPGDQCADTFRQLINLQYQEVAANFDSGQPECYDPAFGLQFTDLTIESDQIQTWNWNFGDGQMSTAPNPIHFFEQDGLYNVSLNVVAFNGCKSKLDTTITIESIDEFTLSDTIALCLSDSVQLDLEIEGEHTYLWSPSIGLDDATLQNPTAFPIVNTTYTVQIFTVRASGDTCIQSAEITVLTDYPVPTVENVSDSIQCDSLVVLSTNLTNSDQVTWSNNNNFTDNISQSSEFTILQEEREKWYYIKASHEYCFTTDSIFIQQEGIFIDIEDETICVGEELMLNAEVTSNDNALTYRWIFVEDTLITSNPQLNISPQTSTVILLLVENSSGCEKIKPIEISVNELPFVEAVATPSTVINTQTIELTATNNPNYQYNWFPEELVNNSNNRNASARVEATSTFIVQVVDENGCLNTDTVTVTVIEEICDEPNNFIPNAFSPNNDGLNDVFQIQGSVIETLQLNIFDRWGNDVFSTNDLSIPWKGEELANDVYGYSLEIVCFGGQRFVKSGSITIIR
ncbi:MAG: PKD domain-containing protein [Chitinophagales bacterium]